MSNRRSILMLLAGIVLLLAAHFAVDCSRGSGGGPVPRAVLLSPAGGGSGPSSPPFTPGRAHSEVTPLPDLPRAPPPRIPT